MGMDSKKHYSRFWWRGGLIGLFIPLILFILNNFNGSNPIIYLLTCALALIEVPVVVLGRFLRLPIETGETAFIQYQLTTFGYVLTVFFWAFTGAFFGWIIDKIKK